jgi:hypothetical protein
MIGTGWYVRDFDVMNPVWYLSGEYGQQGAG